MPGSKRESEKGKEHQSVPMNVILLKNEVDLEWKLILIWNKLTKKEKILN